MSSFIELHAQLSPLFWAVTGPGRDLHLLSLLLQDMGPRDILENPKLIEQACLWGNIEAAMLLNTYGFQPDLVSVAGQAMLSRILQTLQADVEASSVSRSPSPTPQASNLAIGGEGKRKLESPSSSTSIPEDHDAKKIKAVSYVPSDAPPPVIDPGHPTSYSQSVANANVVMLQKELADKTASLEKALEDLSAAGDELKTKEASLQFYLLAVDTERKNTQAAERRLHTVGDRLKEAIGPDQHALVDQLLQGGDPDKTKLTQAVHVGVLPQTHAQQAKIVELEEQLQQVRESKREKMNELAKESGSAKVQASKAAKELQAASKEMEGLKSQLVKAQDEAAQAKAHKELIDKIKKELQAASKEM